MSQNNCGPLPYTLSGRDMQRIYFFILVVVSHALPMGNQVEILCNIILIEMSTWFESKIYMLAHNEPLTKSKHKFKSIFMLNPVW